MREALRAADRLREEVGCPPDKPLDVQTVLMQRFEVAFWLLPGLSVAALRDWYARFELAVPAPLLFCRDRQLRGGLVASHGRAILFADRDDSPEEIRFTFAHEAKHFLQDHLYPRLDLLARFGPTILPVLNGERPPSREERIDALLARATLTQHTHLLGRDAPQSADLDHIEAEADRFACELLAPLTPRLRGRFPSVNLDEESVERVARVLVGEFGLPDAPAEAYAREWVGENGQPVSLLARLRLVSS